MGLFWRDDFEGAGPSLGGSDRSAGAHPDPDDGTGPDPRLLGNYFFRTDQLGAFGAPGGLTNTFTGIQGSSYWRGEDVEDALGNQNPDPALGVLDWTGIDIAGQTGIGFSGLFVGADGREVVPSRRRTSWASATPSTGAPM